MKCSIMKIGSKFGYGTFQNANNMGADPTAQMIRLVFAFVIRNPPKTGFLTLNPFIMIKRQHNYSTTENI